MTPVPTPQRFLASPALSPAVARSPFMKLDIYNLTDRSLLCHWNFKSPQEHHILLPNQPTNVKTPSRTSVMTLTAHQSISQGGQKDEIWLSTTSFSLECRSRVLWTVMELDESAPWIIYRARVSRVNDLALDQSQIASLRFPEGTINCSFSLRETRLHFCLDCPIMRLCLHFAFQVSPIPRRALLSFN